jgi:hypothetical protein
MQTTGHDITPNRADATAVAVGGACVSAYDAA